MHINKDEVLRYLGYKGQYINAELNFLIDSCIEEIKHIAKPLSTFRIFEIKVSEDDIELLKCSLSLNGKDIKNHLINSNICVVLAASLGAAVDNRIRYLNKVDMTRALILDACATEAVESLCNIAEKEIQDYAKNAGLSLTHRYSPGYGDFPLSSQPQILKLLKAQENIGLTCTEDFILIPRKSITAIIGLYKDQGHFPFETNLKDCKSCNICSSRDTCQLSKEG